MLTAGQDPSRASFGLVLLHGRGAGARDIIGLGEALALPDLAFAAPEAPGRSWWRTSFLAPAAQMEPSVQRGMAQVAAAVTEFEAAGLPRNRIGLLGFSQGSCLAAEYLARRGAGLGFGFILSGGLVGTADASSAADPALYGYPDKLFDYASNLSGLSLYASCHENDPHIPLKRFLDSAAEFRRLGAEVTDRTVPGAGHGIDDQDIAAVRAALNTAPERKAM